MTAKVIEPGQDRLFKARALGLGDALVPPLRVFADVWLKAHDIVIPAAGDTHAAVGITPRRLAEIAGAKWVDVAQR